MRLIILLFTIFCTLNGNIVFSDGKDNNIIFLGELSSTLKYKVYKNKKIIFINPNKLKQSNQYSTNKFILFLNENYLSFKSIKNKLWKIELYNNKLYIKKINEEKFKILDLNFYFDTVNNHWFKLAFKSKDNQIIGFIYYDYNKKEKYKFNIFFKIDKEIISNYLFIDYHKEL